MIKEITKMHPENDGMKKKMPKAQVNLKDSCLKCASLRCGLQQTPWRI